MRHTLKKLWAFRPLRRLHSRERGVALVLLALMLPVLAGMVSLVLDVGQLYEARRQVQTATDAAALAGAAYLPESPSAAVAAAIDYAARNHVTIDPSDVEVYETHAANDTIRVTGVRNVGFGFARVLGMSQHDVNASAKVMVGSAGGGIGIMPWALFPPDTYDYPDEVILHLAPQSNHGGNFGPLAIDGTGGNVYRTTIVHGSQQKLKKGDWVDTETGNMSGPTRQGLNQLIGSDSTTFDQAVESNGDGTMRILAPNCPRLVIVPIIQELPKGGRINVQIVGFAQVFITDFGGNGNDCWVKARFVRTIDPDALWSPLDDDYGLRALKLVE